MPDRRGDGERVSRASSRRTRRWTRPRGRGGARRPGEPGGHVAAGIEQALAERGPARRGGARARPPVHLARVRRGDSRGVRGGAVIRVGVDVSPVRQTRAGTARVIARACSSQPMAGDRAGLDASASASPRSRNARTSYRAWYPLVLPRLARRERLDVLTAPRFAARSYRPRARVVVTVHDLAVLRHPETFDQWTRRTAAVCLSGGAVGEARDRRVGVTKRELVELLATPAEKIRVVPNGVSERSSRRTAPAEAGDYVLAVGTLEPRKNLTRLADATRRLGVELRVAGDAGWGDVRLAATVSACSVASPTRSLPVSTAVRAASRIRRWRRASGSRSSRRWPAARPS